MKLFAWLMITCVSVAAIIPAKREASQPIPVKKIASPVKQHPEPARYLDNMENFGK